MASTIGNITNRSPWLVKVVRNPQRNQQFPLSSKTAAEDYMATFLARGFKASLEQLQTSSQLRIRRKGAKEYPNLRYGAGGYSGAAARITMRELMECYRDEIYPEHKRWRH